MVAQLNIHHLRRLRFGNTPIKIDNMDFDIKHHSENSVSIKCSSGYINLSDSKWDSIINTALDRTDICLFSGLRLEYFDNELPKYINLASEDANVDYQNLIVELKESQLLLGRGLISSIWNYYTYPGLIFLKDRRNKEKLVFMWNKRTGFKKIFDEISGIYLLDKSFEEDVLWISKSDDMEALI